jgi:RNA polymerase sigma factor (sigma-70 family)
LIGPECMVRCIFGRSASAEARVGRTQHGFLNTPDRRMSQEPSFTEFIRRIRAGDADAATELVRHYEPVVRLEVRLRVADRSLRRAFDSMDICQSVMANFFVRVAAGEFDLEQPQDLIKLLVVMARNKLAFHVRKERAIRRDHRRIEVASPEQLEGARTVSSPSEEVAGRELLTAFRQRLSVEERQLADLRARGEDWAGIAAALGGTAAGRRKQLERAIDRVARQLGLEGDGDG